MSFIFTEADYARLATLFGGTLGSIGTGPYAGYKPETREAPNGDYMTCPNCDGQGYAVVSAYPKCKACHGTGRVPNGDTVECKKCRGTGCFHGTKCPSICDSDEGCIDCQGCHGTGRVPNVDTGKRYLHVALKYNPPAWALEYLARAHFEACRVATALGVPPEFRPHEADATLRVIEYPSAAHPWGPPDKMGGRTCTLCDRDDDRIGCAPVDVRTCPKLAGAGSAEHTDFDLFTILCWRSTPEDLEITPDRDFGISYTKKACAYHARSEARKIDPHLHIGELGELVGLGPATPHRVPARPYAQRSIVYFAMPDHAARLPCASCQNHAAPHNHPYFGKTCGFGLTVGEWVAERIARSRVKGYT